MSENLENKATLFAKMAKVMSQLQTFGKDATNKFHKYDYVSAAQVSQTIGRAMGNAGIAFFSSTEKVERTDDKRYIVYYQYTFACSDTGATFTTQWCGEATHTTSGGAIDDKALNKAATTALKYFLLNTFVVSSSDSVEVDETQNQQRPKSWLEDEAQVEFVKTELDELRGEYGVTLVNDIKNQSNPREFLNAWAYMKAVEALVQEMVVKMRENKNIEAAEGQMDGSIANKPPTQDTLLEPNFADGLSRGDEIKVGHRRKKVIEHFESAQSGEETMAVANRLNIDWVNTESAEIIAEIEAEIALAG